jgi:hypothetical protein
MILLPAKNERERYLNLAIFRMTAIPVIPMKMTGIAVILKNAENQIVSGFVLSNIPVGFIQWDLYRRNLHLSFDKHSNNFKRQFSLFFELPILSIQGRWKIFMIGSVRKILSFQTDPLFWIERFIQELARIKNDCRAGSC